MNSLEVPSILLGALLTAFGAVAVRLIWRYIERLLNGKAQVIWATTHNAEYRSSNEVDSLLLDLHRDASRNNATWNENKKFIDLKRELELPYSTLTIVLYNVGNATAAKTVLLMSNEPLKILVYPEIAIHRKNTADGKVEIQLDAFNSGEHYRISFFGLQSYHLKRVSYDGVEAREYSSGEVIPQRYIEEKKFAALYRSWIFVSILLIAVSIGGIAWEFLPMFGSDSENSTSETGHKE